MGKGMSKIIWGFILGVIGAIVPVFGIPVLIVGVVMVIWGMFQFWFGAGKTVAKGAVRAVGAGSKKGTGKL